MKRLITDVTHFDLLLHISVYTQLVINDFYPHITQISAD